MPGVNLVVAVLQFSGTPEIEDAIDTGDPEASSGQDINPTLHPRVDIALEGVNAGLVKLAFIGLPLASLTEVEAGHIRTGRLKGTIINLGVDVVESGVTVGDFEENSGLNGSNMGDIAAADLL